MLTRWDPFREMFALQRSMNRLLDQALENETPWSESPSWGLALDVKENKDEFTVKASVPGVNPDDIEITFTDNVLTIKGETRLEEEKKEEHVHLRERRWGTFSRSLSLPSKVQGENITANYDNGVLTLRLPKAEEVKPKKITINAGSGQPMIEGKSRNGS